MDSTTDLVEYESGKIYLQIPRSVIESITVSGSNDAQVAEGKQHVNLSEYTDAILREHVEEYGVEGTDVMDRNTLEDYVLWLACWDIFDSE